MMPDMNLHARDVPRRWLALRATIIVLAAALVPVFFADMFVTVTRLLRPSFGALAWTVPAATEGSFAVLFLLGLLLLAEGKPMGWLQWTPYPFAAAALLLNVYASRGDLPAMVGHAVVTVAFFLPLIAGEAAVRSLSRSADDIAVAVEFAAARRYAIDLVRGRKGVFWRVRVPSLLRTRIVAGRFPAHAAAAVRDGASYGGAAKWESAVELMVTDALTQGVRMAVTVERRRAQITAPEPPVDDSQPARHNDRQKPVSDTVRKHAKVERLLTVTPPLSVREVARQAGVSESTVSRVKRGLPGARHGLSAVR